MSLVEHAQRELELCGQAAENPAYAQSVVAAVAAFASYSGHSGHSEVEAIEQLYRLLKFEALAPLTDDPDEWIDRSAESGSPMWQNARDSRAMSPDGGKTWWYVDARHAGEQCKSGDRWEPGPHGGDGAAQVEPGRVQPETLRRELASLLNRWSLENRSNTPDFILAEYLARCLDAFDAAVNARSNWYGRHDAPGQTEVAA